MLERCGRCIAAYKSAFERVGGDIFPGEMSQGRSSCGGYDALPDFVEPSISCHQHRRGMAIAPLILIAIRDGIVQAYQQTPENVAQSVTRNDRIVSSKQASFLIPTLKDFPAYPNRCTSTDRRCDSGTNDRLMVSLSVRWTISRCDGLASQNNQCSRGRLRISITSTILYNFRIQPMLRVL